MYYWNHEKDIRLQTYRGISFDDIVDAIQDGKILDIKIHENQIKYPGQKLMIIQLQNYAYRVPFVEHKKGIWLKTIIPSRKETDFYHLR